MAHLKAILAVLLILSVHSDMFGLETRSLQALTLNSDTDSFRDLVHNRNMKKIKDHNQKKKSYQLGSNQFISLTLEEFQARYTSNIKLPIEAPSIETSLPRIGAAVSVPANQVIDWEAQGKVSPIKDQGTCNCCYAFSAIADVESSYLIKSKTLYDFSEQ